jgi:YVTN family beta-propeller protein
VRLSHALVLAVAVGILVPGCRRSDSDRPTVVQTVPVEQPVPPPDTLLPGMPPPADSHNIYAAAGAGMVSPAARGALPRVYVPNGGAASVSVIDPATYKVVRTFPTGAVPQHVVPAYDLATLWVANEAGNSLTPIDPVTGEPGPRVPVADPYNMYFTPDGRYAIVVAERQRRLYFRDPHTMALHDSVSVACSGVDHMDFTADGRYAIASCEFSGQLLKLDVVTHAILGYLQLPADSFGHAMPQDVRSAPDGRVFYIADLTADGVHLLDPVTFTTIGFIHTGIGAHAIYPSRDGRLLYVANRGARTVMAGRHGVGSVSVIDPATRTVVATWPVPGGGSPDMGNVSADGKELWLSGRFDYEVYVFDTNSGVITHRIPVERGPHGLTVWPQPGRYSLGHTGNMR